jgi:hypothetical protein
LIEAFARLPTMYPTGWSILSLRRT